MKENWKVGPDLSCQSWPWSMHFILSCLLSRVHSGLLREPMQSHSHHEWHAGSTQYISVSFCWLNTNPVKMKMTLLLWNRSFKTSNASPKELEFSENCFRIWELAISRPVLSNPHLTVASTRGWLWHDSVSKNDPSSPVVQIWTVEKVRWLQILKL